MPPERHALLHLPARADLIQYTCQETGGATLPDPKAKAKGKSTPKAKGKAKSSAKSSAKGSTKGSGAPKEEKDTTPAPKVVMKRPSALRKSTTTTSELPEQEPAAVHAEEKEQPKKRPATKENPKGQVCLKKMRWPFVFESRIISR